MTETEKLQTQLQRALRTIETITAQRNEEASRRADIIVGANEEIEKLNKRVKELEEQVAKFGTETRDPAGATKPEAIEAPVNGASASN